MGHNLKANLMTDITRMDKRVTGNGSHKYERATKKVIPVYNCLDLIVMALAIIFIACNNIVFIR